MNNAQVIGIREVWSLATETMTAKEMAQTAHNLRRDGQVAVCLDGRWFKWNDEKQIWERMR